MIRVFVIAPTPMLQAGLRSMLTTPSIEVVGEATMPAALQADLPGIDVIVVADPLLLEEVVRTLTNDHSLALVALADNHAESSAFYPDQAPLQLLRSLELRGWGIVPIDAPAEQLQAAIAATAQGLIVLPSFHPSWLYERMPVVATNNIPIVDEALTSREREVLELVSQGLSNKLIARRLQISEHTVKFHVSSISTKLGAASRTDAVSRGLRRGLITL
ncbi:MAG: LuxR C-terminal-related transcriptional regulator [Ktedonobacteraceae bacterium]